MLTESQLLEKGFTPEAAESFVKTIDAMMQPLRHRIADLEAQVARLRWKDDAA